MKILIIANFPLSTGGSGIYTRSIAKLLSRKGHEVTVAACDVKHRKYRSFNYVPIIFRQNPKRKKYDVSIKLPCFNTNPATDFRFLHMTKNQLKIYLEALEKRIGELIKEVQPDIIHVQHVWLTGYVVSKFDVPFIFTAHNTDQIAFEDPRCARFRRYVRRAVKKSRKIICVSGQVVDNVRRLYKVRTKATIIFNGADPSIFHKEKVDKKKLLRKYKVKFHDYIVLMVGRLSVLKGIKYLLRAARYWESSGLDIGTIIIGEGIQRRKYEEYIKEKLKNAYMLGHLMQKEIQDFYNIADCTVIPSLKEGFGLVAVESMLCGTPVIATDVGGLPEIITKRSGIIIKPKARFFIYKEVMNFLNNNLKRKMGSDCIKYAKRQFTWENIILKMERVYKDATSS